MIDVVGSIKTVAPVNKLLIAALMLICASATDAQTPQSRSHGSGLEGWFPVGSWTVLLLPLSNGNYVCTAITREPPWGPAGYAMAFVFSLAATHFYLYYDDPAVPTPRELVLAVDGEMLARLTVIEHQPVEHDGQHLIVADLPGNMFVRQVVPPMLNGETLTVTAGRHRYTMPIGGFRAVMQEIADCARTVGAIIGRRS